MFGLYIHIPYCLQRCSYCDFATYVYDQILPPKEYVEFLKKELHLKKDLVSQKTLSSIYFGGGTPSLLEPYLIVSLLEEIAKCGFTISPSTEITLEINPATLNTEKILSLIRAGVNRFSVGAQTFDEELLKAAGRKHSAKDTFDTLNLLREQNVNYSFDLLFALPHQSRERLAKDLSIISELRPPHLSAYCLTVPTGHPMSTDRAHDEDQAAMFKDIEDCLDLCGLKRYEISNFAIPNFESQHNLLYWRQQPYLSIGLSAHSFLNTHTKWGDRFWNPSSVEKYIEFVDSGMTTGSLDGHKKLKLIETLSEKESLFDYCHTALRLDEGINIASLTAKYSSDLESHLKERIQPLVRSGLIENTMTHWKLTAQGRLLSNLVFERIML
jgi:oxygen-independent coproporphyrinogen-3 oxidase